MGALRAELGRGGKLRPAVGARPRQGSRALLAELRAQVVLMLAPRTLHRALPRAARGHKTVDAPRLRGGRTLARATRRVNTDHPMSKSSTRPRQVGRVDAGPQQRTQELPGKL